MLDKYLKINPRIEEALKNNEPIVALESTIISHGMPYPKNLETALHCEEIIRNAGAVPATIAVIDGKMVVGLTKEEIERIAKEGSKVIKTSRRDLPVIIASKSLGATTVSATMFIASLASIRFFATGGIGGVHRGVNETMDISADLEELAITNVCVVCAGAKAILDLPRTMEYLETKGVPVIGYQTDYLPAFYTRKSDCKVNYRFDEVNSIVNMLKAKWEIGLNGGVLVTNPISEEDSLDEEVMNSAINQAIEQMNQLGIKGKETTPYLLKTIVELTNGKSLESNISLVYNNCRLASNLAIEYQK